MKSIENLFRSLAFGVGVLLVALLGLGGISEAIGLSSAPHPCKDKVKEAATGLVPVSLQYTENGAIKNWQIQIAGNKSAQPKHPGVTNPKSHTIKISMDAIYKMTMHSKGVPQGTKDAIKQEIVNGGTSHILCGRAIGVLVHELLHLCLGASHDGSTALNCAHLAIDIKSAELLCGKAASLRCDDLAALQDAIANETDPDELEELEGELEGLQGALEGICLEIDELNEKWEPDTESPQHQGVLNIVTDCAEHGSSAPFDEGAPAACLPGSFPTVDPATGELVGSLGEVIPECSACSDDFDCGEGQEDE